MSISQPTDSSQPLPRTNSGPGSDRSWSIDEVIRALQLDASRRSFGSSVLTDEQLSSDARMPLRSGESSIAETQRIVSGRYRGRQGTYEIELRIDVDGRRPAMCVSADLFKIAGATLIYHSSLILNGPSISATATQIQLEGIASFTSPSDHPKIQVTVPRASTLAPPPQAVVSFLSTNGAAGNTFHCDFESIFFRTVQYEHDYVEGRMPFSEYNTSLLPSGGAGRTLSVASSYAEAGIEMQVTGVTPVVPASDSGADSIWTNAELHAAMQSYFSLWKDEPQWKVWLFTATMHQMGTGLRGIMYDQQGKQRQGCAVFDDVIGGADATSLRGQLRTCVHELGHCFNLMHSWQKSLAVPPAPDRLDALSFMNYVQNFPGGEAAYWAAFPFQFDDQEIVHLRHGFRSNVILGGSNFTIGAADIDPAMFSETLTDNSGLELKIDARKSYAFAEPVVAEIKLYVTDGRGKRVHSQLHPNCGFVRIAIRKPSGQVVMYEPLMVHCFEGELARLDQNTPSAYDSAYLGFGRQGFYFDQVGFYQLRGVYFAPDGSHVFSNVQSLRVRAPRNDEDEEVADLLFGDEQGQLLYLLGSDSEHLKNGNNALEEVLNKYAAHPLAAYARLVQGINAGREFKTIVPEKAVREVMTSESTSPRLGMPKRTIDVRKPERVKSEQLLGDLVQTATETKIVGTGSLDNITLGMVMRELASVQQAAGHENLALETLNGMVKTFGNMNLRPHVMRVIESQAKAVFESTRASEPLPKRPRSPKK